MLKISCPARQCLHNDKRGWCDVDGIVDMRMEEFIHEGAPDYIVTCLDYTPLTNDEYRRIMNK